MPTLFDVEGRLRRRWPLGWHVYQETRRANVGFMARSVAFQALLALVPLFVAVFVLVATVAGRPLANEVLSLTSGFLPQEASSALAAAIAGKIRANTTSVISVALLVWAALGLFKGLDMAFSLIYKTRANNSFLDQLVDAVVAFLVLLVAVVAAVVTASLPSLLPGPFVDVAASLLLFFGLTIAFFPMYYRFPDEPISVRAALPGVVLAALGWTVLQALFRFYVAFAADPSISGAVGGILILMAWLYLGIFVLLFGGVVNKTLSDHRAEGGVPPTSVGA